MTDTQINDITERVVKNVRNAKFYNISTACFINNEFICVSEYDVSEGMYELLEATAKVIQNK